MEFLSIVDAKTGELTGERLSRAEVFERKAWCCSTNVYVVNSKGELLCHQRSLQKERFPGAWSTHLGGHVSHEESYEENAHKELAEEAGIDVPLGSLIAWRTTRNERARLWTREFVTHSDLPAEAFIPQPGEVERFVWMHPRDIASAVLTADMDQWMAGIHDFRVEYHCLRAALGTAAALGAVALPQSLVAWQLVI